MIVDLTQFYYYLLNCFLLLIVFTLSINYLSILKPNSILSAQKLKAKKLQFSNPKETQIVVLDDQFKELYLRNEAATKYVNWKVAKRYFEHLDDYNTVQKIYENLSSSCFCLLNCLPFFLWSGGVPSSLSKAECMNDATFFEICEL